jgi:methionyl-tRNA formyltransferase
LLNVIDSFAGNAIKYTPQDARLATYANKLEKKEGFVNWNSSGRKIHNLVRGLIPWPCAYSFLQKSDTNEKKRIIIRKTCIDDECKTTCNKPPGMINKTSEKGLLVSTCEGSVWITSLQPEGKRVMDAKDYINGYNIMAGDYFSMQD